jgi:4-amino-4-deoxy-L-arabinose transferase-like glycosyltransferase
MSPRPRVRTRSYALAFFVIASFLILGHSPLLRLPFYWDEIGQFVPAALDIFRHGAWIPVSTVPNVHPPGVMAYLAAVWSIVGYSILATRVSMLLLASFGALVSLLLAIELTRGTTGTPAFAALCLLCLSPLFFAQSMLAQLDMPAMGLSVLALLLFLQNRFRDSGLACLALVLVKETGIVAPVLFGSWLLAERGKRALHDALWFLLPVAALLGWLAMLHHATGNWLGNPAFADYNVREPLQPARFLLAAVRRIYYLFIGSGHFIGTLLLIRAWPRMPLFHNRAWRITASFAALHVLLVSLLGGAVLERYLLPVLPILYIAFAASLRAVRPLHRHIALLALLACLIVANFVNPVYPFPYENNLAFVSFVQLQQEAAAAVEADGDAVTATVFPMSDALRNPDFGFVKSARKVIDMADFQPFAIAKLESQVPDAVVVLPHAWDPLHLLRVPAIEDFLERRG